MQSAALFVALGMLLVPELQAAGPTQAEAILARYEVDLVGRSRAMFALPPGPRTIRVFRWVPAPGTSEAWRSIRVRLVWDGDDPADAGVDVPLGQFVSTTKDRPNGASTPFENRRPMPYRRAGRLVLDAEGPVRGSIHLETVPEAHDLDDRGYLRATLQAEPSRAPSPSPSNSNDFSENQAGNSSPPVRYWYDRNPGPSPQDRPG